jgi:hypothetical protein
VSNKALTGIMIAALALMAAACSQSSESNLNTNANSNATDTASTVTTTGPDNSVITTTTDSNGVKTETRTLRDNPRVSRVVVTTRNGERTVKVYSPSGEEKDVSKNEPPDVLHATGDAIADSAGWVKDKSITVADKTKEGAVTVADKTVDVSKKVANKTVDTSKKVADKSVDIGSTVVDKTKTGAKKTGRAIKKVFKP